MQAWVRRIVIAGSALTVLAGLLFGGYLFYARQELKAALLIERPGSIDSLEEIELGGRKQYLLIRGRDRNNPVLLFLHGGPGGSVMADSHLFSRELEKRFVVVQWDQRGAGKSYDPSMRPDEYRIGRFVSDGIELLERLRARFDKPKIYLVGHSWGAVLGVLIADRRPDLVAAYVGAGQPVSKVENELVSYAYAKKWAAEAHDAESLERLARIHPPYDYPDGDRVLRELVTERRILWKHLAGKRRLQPGHVEPGGLWGAMISPYYSPLEAYRARNAELKTIKIMWPEYTHVDLARQVPRLDVPTYFILGRYDYQVVAPLAAKYFERLEAPRKELIWFEHSGHDMMYDEPLRFQQVIIEKLLDDAAPGDRR